MCVLIFGADKLGTIQNKHFQFGTEDALYMLAIAMADQYLTTLQS